MGALPHLRELRSRRRPIDKAVCHRVSSLRIYRYLLWVVLGLVGLEPGRALAGSVEVTPVLVELSATTKNVLVSLRNANPDATRYQVTVQSWRQNTRGEMQLAATQDIIFYPAMLTLAPGEQRNLRIGSAVPFGQAEKSYRLFVEELPQLAKPSEPGQVRVLTRVGIPVFLEPAAPLARGELLDLAQAKGRFSFRIHNAGNVRIRPLAVRAVARGAKGEILADEKIDGWYVLAGDDRFFDVAIPKEVCGRVRILSAEVALERSELRAEIPTPSGACAL